jgi:hypothetical protein
MWQCCNLRTQSFLQFADLRVADADTIVRLTENYHKYKIISYKIYFSFANFKVDLPRKAKKGLNWPMVKKFADLGISRLARICNLRVNKKCVDLRFADWHT